MITFYQVKFCILLGSLTLTLLNNAVLMILAITKSPQKLGNYKHLMCYFSVLSIVFAFFEFMVQPYVHCDAGFVLIMNMQDTVFEGHPKVSMVFLACVSACFHATVFAIAINFIYRYFAIQREGGRLRYFHGKLIFAWMILPILIGMLAMIVMFSLGPSDYTTANLRRIVRETYGINIDKAVYSGCLYWKIDDYGKESLNWKEMSGVMFLNSLMAIPLIAILYFGRKSFQKIKDIVSHGESEYSRKLQTQLYKALVAQTLIPLIFLFLPVAVYFICPLFGCNVEGGNLSFVFLFALYPALDPVPMIFMVDDYRNAFLNFFRRLLRKNQMTPVTAYEQNVN